MLSRPVLLPSPNNLRALKSLRHHVITACAPSILEKSESLEKPKTPCYHSTAAVHWYIFQVTLCSWVETYFEGTVAGREYRHSAVELRDKSVVLSPQPKFVYKHVCLLFVFPLAKYLLKD